MKKIVLYGFRNSDRSQINEIKILLSIVECIYFKKKYVEQHLFHEKRNLYTVDRNFKSRSSFKLVFRNAIRFEFSPLEVKNYKYMYVNKAEKI